MPSTDDTEQENEAGEEYDEPTEQEFNTFLPNPYELAVQVDENEDDVPD